MSPDVVAAWIAGAFTIVTLLIGAVFSAVTGILAIRRARKERHGRLSIEISMAIAKEPELARRFAVGVLKVEKFGLNEEAKGEVRFVPLNARITVGRDPSNEFTLKDVNRAISRMHCGFVSDSDRVYIEDYGSVNGTLLNHEIVGSGMPRMLKSGDKISLPAIGEPIFIVTFFDVHRSSFW